jgi:hypothetical protein
MRSAALLGLLLASSIPLACGGSTPPAKDADDTASKSSGGDTTSASAAPADSSPPAAAPAPDPAPAPAASASSSGDIKPSADDPWMASHQMPPKDVMKTMRAANGKVQACFKAGLKRDPSTSGEVKLKFVISNDGAVKVWKDDASSMTDGDVTQCVGDTLKALKFPKQKSPGDAWGTYSIHFGQ